MDISILKRPAPEDEENAPDESRGDFGGELTEIGAQAKKRLWCRMARECEAMAEHALSAGLSIPAEVAERLEQALSPDGVSPKLNRSYREAGEANAENDAAASPASRQTPSLVSLALAHAALALIVAPATPEALRLLANEREKHPKLCAFGPLPVVRRMLGLAIVSLFTLLGVSLSEHVSTASMNKSLLEQSGYQLLLIEIFLLSASSLGSCFANLQKINAFISDRTYDPKFQSTYWTRWVMGVISGIVLSQLVYDVFAKVGPSNDIIPPALGQPILALLGGYSFEVVYGILNHVMDTISRFFRGARDGLGDNPERAARSAEVLAQERLTTAAYLAGQQRPGGR